VKRQAMTHSFVEYIPAELTDGTIYVSLQYATAIHRCACGCGNKVVTPLSPTDWKLIFDGETISLHPSIGNWSFACQSHYWVRSGKIEWAPTLSRSQIAAGRQANRDAKARQFGPAADVGPVPHERAVGPGKPRRSWLRRLFG
jgi:Family of unknown function (DUF6527)